MSDIILVIEDEPALQETLAYSLKSAGYQVHLAGDGQTGLELARKLKPGLVVLDVMLPVLDGIEVCRILRQESKIPIIMLTARDSEIDRVVGLEMGADDYISKPFSMRELLARIKAAIRRVRMDREDAAAVAQESSESLVFDNLTIDLLRREVRLSGRVLDLKPKEYELLVYLARHRRQVLTRDLLLERVWDWNFTGGSRTVDVHMRWLREKIESDPANPVRIVTVRGAGYRFEG